MICQNCGREAPTRKVEFYQNIGLLFIRLHKNMKGNLCKDCINKFFWPMTLITLFFGWWGIISFFFTLFILPNNIIRYIGALDLAPVPVGAAPPQLTDEAIKKIGPHTEQILIRLKNNEPLDKVANDVSYASGATPGQIILYMRALAQHAQSRQSTAQK
jgi:hypothetical protein